MGPATRRTTRRIETLLRGSDPGQKGVDRGDEGHVVRNLTTHHPTLRFYGCGTRDGGRRGRGPDRIKMAKHCQFMFARFSNHETQQRAEALVSPNAWPPKP